MWILKLVLWMLLLLGFFTGSVLAEDDHDLVYQADEPIVNLTDIQVETVDGEIEVKTTQNEQVHIEIYLSDPSERGEYDYGASRDGSRIRVWIKRKDPISRFLHLFSHSQTRVVLYVPQAFEDGMMLETVSGNVVIRDVCVKLLTTHTVSGNIEVEESSAEHASLHTTSGSVEMDDFACKRMEVNTVSGAIEAEELRCDQLKASSVSGKVEIREIMSTDQAQTIQLHSVSGKIRVGLCSIYPEIEANTVSGAIRLSVPDAESYHVIFSTLSGRLKAFEQTVARDASLSFPQSKGTARLETTSGNITVDLMKKNNE